MSRFAPALVALLAPATVADAQPVGSLDRVLQLLNRGDRVVVTDSSGQELRGHLIDVSPSTLQVDVNGVRVTLDQEEVVLLRARQSDSLANGALLGGAAFAAAALVVGMQGSQNQIALGLSPLLATAGAGIGAVVDAAIQQEPVVYSGLEPNRMSSLRPCCHPTDAGSRRGVTESRGEAPPVRSFDALPRVVNLGDQVAVVDSRGRKIRGVVTELSPSALSLRVDGLRVDLSSSEVSVVRRRHRDPLGDGALWGFLAGAACFYLGAGDIGIHHPEIAWGLTALYGGVGASIGALVDSGVHAYGLVYTSPRPGRSVQVVPIVSHSHRGAALSLGF